MHGAPLETAAVLAFSTRLHVTCITLLQGLRLQLPECSLHSIKSKETREVKTFSTKTSRDVGMVPSVSKEHICLHGKINWQKNVRNKDTIPCPTTQVDILRHQRHSGYVFTYYCEPTATIFPIPPGELLPLVNCFSALNSCPLYIQVSYPPMPLQISISD